eukprot:10928681-Lingulodinium_polyedra.AAC.1
MQLTQNSRYETIPTNVGDDLSFEVLRRSRARPRWSSGLFQGVVGSVLFGLPNCVRVQKSVGRLIMWMHNNNGA